MKTVFQKKNDIIWDLPGGWEKLILVEMGCVSEKLISLEMVGVKKNWYHLRSAVCYRKIDITRDMEGVLEKLLSLEMLWVFKGHTRMEGQLSEVT